MKVARKNAKFQKASPEQKRVMIAKDVLARLEAKKFKPERGRFVVFKFDDKKPKKSEQICNIKTTEKNCRVCAYGALMLSEIGFNDKITIGAGTIPDWDDASMFHIRDHGAADRLEEFFDQEQLRLVELAFERGGGYYRAQDEYERKAESKFSTYSTPRQRMKAIMENIVKNNGEFVV